MKILTNQNADALLQAVVDNYRIAVKLLCRLNLDLREEKDILDSLAQNVLVGTKILYPRSPLAMVLDKYWKSDENNNSEKL